MDLMSTIIEVGKHLLKDQNVQQIILKAAWTGVHAVSVLITPFIGKALIVLGIVLGAVAMVYFAYKVTEWIFDKLGLT